MFVGVEKYGDYRMACLALAKSLGLSKLPENILGRVVTTRLQRYEVSQAYITLPIMRRCDHPFFFITPALFAAVEQTDITFTVDWAAMRLPYEAFVLVPPENRDGLQCVQVARLRVPPGETMRNSAGEPVETVLSLRAFMGDAEGGFMMTMTDPYDPARSLENPAAEDARQRLARIVFNVLFAMAARPEYVERGGVKTIHKKSGRQVRYPNVVGRRYVTRRETGGNAGTHSSPRLHWRRGHFRRQRFGLGSALTKIIWIEPVLVNG